MRTPLNIPEQRCMDLLRELFKGQEELLDNVLSEGLIDLRVAERRAICREVERLYEEGLGRCEAMEVVAQSFCCSYEKVRAAVYTKPTGRSRA